MSATNRTSKEVPIAAIASDRLTPPCDLDRYAVLRALDRERLAEEAPDVDDARLRRIVKIRDEIRRGTYASGERLAIAIARALETGARRGF
jgi:hypothetical protein